MNGENQDINRTQRQKMVDEQIRARGVVDPNVLDALEAVPRERFVTAHQAANAFADRALALEHEQSISQPFVVAAMTAALKLRSTDRVLEVGTGSGYQTAILARLVRDVFTIERIPQLASSARDLLNRLGYTNIQFRTGDGSLGWPETAPFDAIIVTAAAPAIPSALIEQLADGGRLVIPVGGSDEQILTVIERSGNTVREHPKFPVRFVKLIGQGAWPMAIER